MPKQYIFWGVFFVFTLGGLWLWPVVQGQPYPYKNWLWHVLLCVLVGILGYTVFGSAVK